MHNIAGNANQNPRNRLLRFSPKRWKRAPVMSPSSFLCGTERLFGVNVAISPGRFVGQLRLAVSAHFPR
jgi:hypothetical protein